jgi:hypothetical protein
LLLTSLVFVGRWDESIVTFFNDNGGNVWEGGRNYPFRGGKVRAVEKKRESDVKFSKGSLPDTSAASH